MATIMFLLVEREKKKLSKIRIKIKEYDKKITQYI
jgi:hypothetical protein